MSKLHVAGLRRRIERLLSRTHANWTAGLGSALVAVALVLVSGLGDAPAQESAPTQSTAPGVAPGTLKVEGKPAEQVWLFVLPDGMAVTMPPNTSGNTAAFNLNGDDGDVLELSCSRTGSVSSCGPIPPSVVISGGQVELNVPFNTGAIGSGTITLHVENQWGETDTGSYNVTVGDPPAPIADVSPDANAAEAIPSRTGNTARFTVRNKGNASATFNLACSRTGQVTGCSVNPGSVQLAPGSTTYVPVTYTSGAAGSGTVGLTASATGTSDAGSYNVAVRWVAVTSVNPGSTVERSLCLNASLNGEAAAECGDLRLAHALPPTMTMNRTRQPILTYNSQHAHPYPYIQADVTLPSTVPDSITAAVVVNGVQRAKKKWLGNQWTAGSTRRIGLGFDALQDSTGVYAYTLEVTNWHGVSPQATTVTGDLAIVNRANSYFGAGWWLAGLERLYPGATMVWVGGDGSVRRYTSVTTNVWAAPSLESPDTIKWNAALSRYVRSLPGGIQVRFDANGRHMETVPRLGSQHQTTFAYNASQQLSTISLPKPTGAAARNYAFAYTSGKLSSVTAPAIGSVARVTNVSVASGRVTSIQDPDLKTVAFGYDAGFANRITSRTDRRNIVATFGFDAAHKLAKDSLNVGSGQTIVNGIRSLESQVTSPTAKDPATLYVLVNGPRTDVGDTTRFYLDRFGAPWRIRNALNDSTVVIRGDAAFPALATELIHANGFRELATYTARGNLNSQTQLAPYGGGVNATTTYDYANSSWPDFPTRITLPEGDHTSLDYDTATGNRIWQEDGRGEASRLNYRYYTSGTGSGLVRAVDPPLTPADSVVYDALGNLASTRTPLGFWSHYRKDSIGRDTLLDTPVDSAGTIRGKQRFVYDVMGRDTLAMTIGVAMNGAGPDTVKVRKTFDAEGNILRLSRGSAPDRTAIDTVITQWQYDPAGRAIVEIAPDGTPANLADNPRDSSVYDPAGNVREVHTRRNDPTSSQRLVIRTSYDALNRVVQRTTPTVSYTVRNQGIPTQDYIEEWHGPGSDRPYPWYPNDGGSGYRIEADTARFEYDSRGNLKRADNRDAHLRRTYYPNGLIATDTQRIRPLTGTNFEQHKYVLSYMYDRNGRRTELYHPAQLRAGTLRDRVSYAYHPQVGSLQQVTDLLGNVFTFGYDDASRVSSFSRPGGISESYTYDNDGRLKVHNVNNGSPSAFKYSESKLRSATMRYDGRNKLFQTLNTIGPRDELEARYSVLGHVVNGRTESHGKALNGNAADSNTRDTISYDALGNALRSVQQSSYATAGYSTTHTGITNYRYERWTGRLKGTDAPAGRDTTIYDRAGNVEFVTTTGLYSSGARRDRATWYDAEERARAADARVVTSPSTVQPDYTRAFEEYRYDALGRRILVRAQRMCKKNNDDAEGLCQLSTIRRTVWDGNQELYEIQMPGDSASLYLENDTGTVVLGMQDDNGQTQWPDAIDPNPFFGRVAYVHGAGLDQPIGVIRMGYGDLVDEGSITRPHRALAPFLIAPVWTERGQPLLGVMQDGGIRKCDTWVSPMRCVYIAWPELWFAYARPAGNWRTFWHGSLLEDKQDAAGTNYRRNRYYDPQSGRFTQEDPIGLAGGLNVYGYAGGDPVNFSDPFGLNECDGIEDEAKKRECESKKAAGREKDQSLTQCAVQRGIANFHATNEAIWDDGVLAAWRIGSGMALGGQYVTPTGAPGVASFAWRTFTNPVSRTPSFIIPTGARAGTLLTGNAAVRAVATRAATASAVVTAGFQIGVAIGSAGVGVYECSRERI